MSQWNNSYAYNNQYQGANIWNGDLNNQYMNQAYYQNRHFDPTNQYVSFDEFISQMQNNSAGTPAAGNFNNMQHQNFAGSQYNYQNMPSTSMNTQLNSYNYGPNSSVPNEPEGYQAQSQTQQEPNSFTNEMVFKSSLTPTATEFVPKSCLQASVSTENVSSEALALNEGVKESKSTHGSSSSRNWRERPQNSQQNSARHNDRYQQSDSSKQEPNYKNSEASHSRSYEPNHRNQESRNRNQESNHYENSNRNHDSRNGSNRNGRNYETSDSSDSRKYETSRNEPRNYDASDRSDSRKYGTSRNDPRNDDPSERSDSRKYETGRNEPKNYDASDRSDSRKYETGRNEPRNYDPSDRSDSRKYESNNRNDSRNYETNRNQDRNFESNRYDKGQSKLNSKSKRENKDSERTFYNSSINKGSQDVRSGREGSARNRNWVGSQRVRRDNTTEDEQYANSYLQLREEKVERVVRNENVQSPSRGRSKPTTDIKVNTDMTQRERLSEQLDMGTLECLVCCERVKQTDAVWSCSNCYHVLHLRCIRKWAMSSIVEGKWRCPACQNTSEEVPTEYRCMCGAARNPDYQRGAGGAHTCGRACKRPRACVHPCPLLCHPGPCPACMASVTKECGCGAESRSVLCSSKVPQVCSRTCGRLLACNVHHCAKDCHEEACDPCTETVDQVCYCQAGNTRSVPCTAETSASVAWSCSGACSRVLACGAHVCARACHPPPCPRCVLMPDLVITCPCGKTKLEKDKRKKCTDPIPLCGNICAKPLQCGPAGDKHFCKMDCHEGDCPVCPENTLLQCRCGHSSREVPCADLPDMYNNVLCQKKCNKKLSCGRHRCRTVCCAATSHRCAVVCGRTLSCQLHRCEEFCHTGHCAACPSVSFSELRCECGAEVVLPPVRCGTRPPACQAPCRRPRACTHPPHHSCHAGDCPPCVVLTTKMCHGRHEERKTIPCSQEEFSCGLPCGKPLPCGNHTCIKTCHKGPCDTGKCTQPCNEKRPSCGHPCAAPCHAGATGAAAACPSQTACRRLVRATCPCGRRHADRPCCDNARDLNKILSALAATKMLEGGSVDLSDVQRPGAMLKTLECDDECRVEARTRQLALALQIRNPDVSAKLAPRYSDHVRSTAAKEPAFAQQIHDRMTELVQLAKKSKQKTRSHSFPSMNWQKRQFIHELCEHFGCESVAYDAEPNRNVVATADKEKSWLPAMSVLEVLAREAGKRRVPGPILRAPQNAASAALTAASNNKSSSGWATLTSTNAWAARSQARQAAQTSQSNPPSQAAPQLDKIDYFDNPPDN